VFLVLLLLPFRLVVRLFLVVDEEGLMCVGLRWFDSRVRGTSSHILAFSTPPWYIMFMRVAAYSMHALAM